MTDQHVFRYAVPVDDQWHRIDHLADVVHVDCRHAGLVEFWATEPVSVIRADTGGGDFISADYKAAQSGRRCWEYRVYGTGQPDVDGLYVGTALTPDGALVWHLFRREVQP